MNSDEAMHRSLWTLLPWYVNGTLSGAEHQQIQAHLVNCPRCLAEVQRQQVLTQQLALPSAAWRPSTTHFQALMQSIDENAAADQAPSAFANWFTRWRQGWRATPATIRRVMVAQTAFATLLAILLIGARQAAPLTAYRTMTSAPANIEAQLPRLHLVFADNVSERDLRAVLSAINGSIVHGPSPIGVYTVEVADLAQGLTVARMQKTVRLAEPVAGPQ